MVCHLLTGYTAVQYNHYGPRVSAIERYLNAADSALFGNTGYDMAICLRGEAYQRLERLGFIQELEFTIALPGILPGAARQGISVGDALRAPLPEGVEVVTMRLRGRAGGALGRQDSVTMVHDLLERGGDLLAAKVWGKRAEGMGRKRPVDLVKDHLMTDRDVAPARGQRFARADRWVALRGVLAEWLANGQLAR